MLQIQVVRRDIGMAGQYPVLAQNIRCNPGRRQSPLRHDLLANATLHPF
jgi:hypothetical protein